MGHISVLVNGCQYDLACGDGEEERVRRLAGEIDAQIKAIATTSGSVPETLLLLMVSLTLADRLAEARADLAACAERFAAEHRQASAREAFLATYIDDFAKRIRTIAECLAGA